MADKSMAELLTEADAKLAEAAQAAEVFRSQVVGLGAEKQELAAKLDEASKKIESLEAQSALCNEQLSSLRGEADALRVRAELAESKLANPAHMSIAGSEERVEDAADEAAPKRDILAEFSVITDPVARAKFVSENMDELKKLIR